MKKHSSYNKLNPTEALCSAMLRNRRASVATREAITTAVAEDLAHRSVVCALQK